MCIILTRGVALMLNSYISSVGFLWVTVDTCRGSSAIVRLKASDFVLAVISLAQQSGTYCNVVYYIQRGEIT